MPGYPGNLSAMTMKGFEEGIKHKAAIFEEEVSN